MQSKKEFAARRHQLFRAMGQEGAAIIFSSAEKIRTGDVHYPFRQNSDFYYLTGFEEPGAVALFISGQQKDQFILFSQPSDPLVERWIGKRIGQQGALKDYGADAAFNIAELDDKIVELLGHQKIIFYHLGQEVSWDQKINQWLAKIHATTRKSYPHPSTLSDLSAITYEMRVIKSPYEIELMQKACEISAVAHRKLMEKCRVGMYEYELEAQFNYDIMLKGCRFYAYPSIVGGGENACTLHYIENKFKLNDGQLVLIDAGAEYQNYAADITRTFPVNGKFTEEQALIYNLVLKAQLAVIALIKPGVSWNKLQETAELVLTQGLIDLKIIQTTLEKALEKKYYQKYYMHGIGHWLGLDVHDVGAYKLNGEWRKLEAGMVLTVEPGLYFSPDQALNKKWWNIGVRIEDDVVVTATGCAVLTAHAPKTIEEIEQIMMASEH